MVQPTAGRMPRLTRDATAPEDPLGGEAVFEVATLHSRNFRTTVPMISRQKPSSAW